MAGWQAAFDWTAIEIMSLGRDGCTCAKTHRGTGKGLYGAQRRPNEKRKCVESFTVLFVL